VRGREREIAFFWPRQKEEKKGTDLFVCNNLVVSLTEKRRKKNVKRRFNVM